LCQQVRRGCLGVALGLLTCMCGDSQSGPAKDLEPALRQSVADHPSSFDSNYNLGEFYLHAGQLALAIPYMERAHQADRSHYACGYDLALAQFELGRYARARDVIRGLLALQNSAELHGLLGDVEEKAGDFVAAVHEYQSAAQLDPSEAHIIDLGSELLTHENGSAAAAVFQHGVQSFPASYKLHVALGIADYQVSQFAGAAKEFIAATHLKPEAAEPYLLLGTLHGFPEGRTVEVEALMRRFIEQEPKNARGHYNLGMLYWERDRESVRDTGRAEELFRKAVALNPRYDDACFQLGILHARKQDYASAITWLERAVQLNPRYTLAYFQLGTAYRRAGKASEAAASFQKYRELRQYERDADDQRRTEMTRFVVSMKEEAAQVPR
jgi:tetratricopeptide (TPR) repeat protein